METSHLRVTPIEPAIALPIQPLGLPWKILVTLWVMGGLFVMILWGMRGSFPKWQAAIVPVSHALIALANHIDPFFFQALWRYYRQAGLYDPWPHERESKLSRPNGFGRGALL